MNDNSIKFISEIFIGEGDFYSYKSGSVLVKFFNKYWGASDKYGPGFPSRWAYTATKIENIIRTGIFNDFLSMILSKAFIMNDLKIDEVEAIEQRKKILIEINSRLKFEKQEIVGKGDKYKLVNEDEELEFVGEGGFAKVFRKRTTRIIVKKLLDEYVEDDGIKSRFKREFHITESLSDIPGIIQVYEFDSDKCLYTMEAAEKTLHQYVNEFDLPEKNKIVCIRQILSVMAKVHMRNIVHRDISPNNILLFNGVLKITDFGLGKDLNALTSHKTNVTKAFGQTAYCAPEQFMSLKEGDKQSDVYSLGRLVNFLLTGNPNNSHHFLRSVSEKSTSLNTLFRYSDAGEMLKAIERSIEYHQNSEQKLIIEDKLSKNIYDQDVANYFYELNGGELCSLLIEKASYERIVLQFMKESEENAEYIIQSIGDSFKEECVSFESHDPIARFSYNVLMEKELSFVVKEIAAKMLKYIASYVNRYNAQNLVEAAVKYGVEPMIEDILTLSD